MKSRMLLIVTLSIVLSLSMAHAQEQDGGSTPEKALETIVFTLQYYPADDMDFILAGMIPGVRIAVDDVSNRLIATGPSVELEKIARLITELDVPGTSELPGQPIMCRVYMLEQASQYQDLIPFRLVTRGSTQFLSGEVLNALQGTRLQIESFSQDQLDENLWRFDIRGRVASSEDIDRLTQSIPDCKITDLNWKNNTPVMPTTQVAPLPVALQKHIDRFLGEGTGIVGYWFGNLSVPGSVQAPIGPWTFEFKVKRLGTGDLLDLNLSVVEERGEKTWEILHNAMQGKIGRPVIIGYNRDQQGAATMGALVLIPEPMPEVQ